MRCLFLHSKFNNCCNYIEKNMKTSPATNPLDQTTHLLCPFRHLTSCERRLKPRVALDHPACTGPLGSRASSSLRLSSLPPANTLYDQHTCASSSTWGLDSLSPFLSEANENVRGERSRAARWAARPPKTSARRAQGSLFRRI